MFNFTLTLKEAAVRDGLLMHIIADHVSTSDWCTWLNRKYISFPYGYFYTNSWKRSLLRQRGQYKTKGHSNIVKSERCVQGRRDSLVLT